VAIGEKALGNRFADKENIFMDVNEVVLGIG
jgi:hypothetical protein